MEDLPVELVNMTLCSADTMTLSVVRCVNKTVSAHVNDIQMLPRVRAIHYARQLIERRRWNLLD